MPHHDPSDLCLSVYRFFARFRVSTSASANVIAALTNCTTLIHCFAAQMGRVAMATTQGHVWFWAKLGKLRR
jgi:hypothetical protein